MMLENNLFREIYRMQEEMNKIFDRIFNDYSFNTPLLTRQPQVMAPAKSQFFYPSMQLMRPLTEWVETKDKYIATIELPGINKEDIDLTIGDKHLELKINKQHEDKKEDKKAGFYRYEKNYAGYYQKILLPENIRAENINATYKNGILEIEIPKDKKANNNKKIEIR